MNIVLKGVDGSIAIMTLAPGADKEEAMRKFHESHPNEYLKEHVEYEGKFPSDREFRDAWTIASNRIVVDKDKAQDIHLGRIRHARNKALDKLDREQLRYLGDAAKVLEVEARKQLLRDLPANVKGLDWPDDLERI